MGLQENGKELRRLTAPKIDQFRSAMAEQKVRQAPPARITVSAGRRRLRRLYTPGLESDGQRSLSTNFGWHTSQGTELPNGRIEADSLHRHHHLGDS
jgi:hypothetical protein